jgi:hypothetical protein
MNDKKGDVIPYAFIVPWLSVERIKSGAWKQLNAST